MRFPLPSRAFEHPYWAAAPVTDPRKKTTAINFMLSLAFNRPYSTIAASRTPTMPKLGVADLFRTSSLHKLAKQARHDQTETPTGRPFALSMIHWLTLCP